MFKVMKLHGVFKVQIGSNIDRCADVMTSTCCVCKKSNLSVFTGSVIIPNSFRKLLNIRKSINHLCTLCDSNTIELDSFVHTYYCCVHKLNSQDYLASTIKWILFNFSAYNFIMLRENLVVH